MIKNCKYSIIFQVCGIVMAVIFLVSSCKKKAIIGEDAYGGGIGSFGIKFLNETPEPEIAAPGTAVMIQVEGLKEYQDTLKFFVNQTEAEVQEVSDSTIVVIVPETASSGGTSVEIKGQIFFGPEIKVSGNVEADYFEGAGIDGFILDYKLLTSGNYLLTGAIKDYNTQATKDKPISNLLQIRPDGVYQTSLEFGKGAGGAVYTINQLPDGSFVIGGSFNSYHNENGIQNITRLNADGTLDTMIVHLRNPDPTDIINNSDTVAAFNGGVIGRVQRTFITTDDTTVTLVGRFSKYVRYFYEESTKEQKIRDETAISQLVRLKLSDGSMDSTFNFDELTNQSGAGGNGAINDAVIQNDGKIIIVGEFTSFHGQPANRIARINKDGTLDATYNAGGTGANENINSITYNPTTQKYLISGIFTNYNGKETRGIAMLDAEGKNDAGFEFGELTGGVANYAAQLNDGKIIVSGTFDRYRNVVRQGFMILNSDGTLSAKYNNTGSFQGVIEAIHESPGTAATSVLLMGNISRFDNEKVGNIVRINITN